MNEHFGWAQGSDMSAVYVHLSGKNVDTALLNTYGIKMDQPTDTGVFKPKVCERCGVWNEFTNLVCDKCHEFLEAIPSVSTVNGTHVNQG